MVMIPKTEAFKWRLFALLVTPYRVWVRAASEDISDWMRTVDRNWVANGPKKSSEDAIYQIALDTEGDMGSYGTINVLTMDGLETGFEREWHQTLRDKASLFNFSLIKLNMALSMYTSSRRIRCGRAFSRTATRCGGICGLPHCYGPLAACQS